MRTSSRTRSLCKQNYNKQKMKTKEKLKEMKKRHDISTPSSAAISSLLGDDLLCDILCRFPAKSLMRLKSVCKHWQSLIQYNPHFFDLHYTRSKTHPSLLIRCPPKYDEESTVFFSVDDFLKGDGAAALRKVTVPWPNHMLNPVNGLICFISRTSVLIYNPSTREQTPWIETSITKVEKEIENGVEIVRRYNPCYGFGFDPGTKEHKVVCIWHIYTYRWPQTHLPWSHDSVELVCDILTVGDNSWRRIDVVPPYELTFCSVCGTLFNPNSSVYVNGSIYWLTDSEIEVIVAFDVGSEIFRVISVPSIMDGISLGEDLNCLDLLGVNGSIALIERPNRRSRHGRRGKNMLKMLRFDDKEKSITAGTNNNDNWNVETIYWKCDSDQRRGKDGPRVRKYYCSFEAIAGEDLIVRKQRENEFSIYYYNRKEKNYRKKLEITIDQIPINEDYYRDLHTTPFVESLFPVQKQKRVF